MAKWASPGSASSLPAFTAPSAVSPRWSFRMTAWCWGSTAASGKTLWASSTTSSRPRGAARTPARRMRRPWNVACANPVSCATSWAASSWRDWPPGRKYALWWEINIYVVNAQTAGLREWRYRFEGEKKIDQKQYCACSWKIHVKCAMTQTCWKRLCSICRSRPTVWRRRCSCPSQISLSGRRMEARKQATRVDHTLTTPLTIPLIMHVRIPFVHSVFQ